jgi:uncharacterized protein DUF6455
MNTQAIPLGDIERHFWLTRSVARSIGVNLSEAMAENHLSPEDYSIMVTQCRAEGCHEACQRWLASQTTAIADGPPAYCANADLFTRLSGTCKRR